MTRNSRQLGRELRDGRGDFLDGRRAGVMLAAVSMASLAVVALYQLGVLKRLPEPPIPGLDAEKVNGSTEAYQLLKTPDAVLGLGSYAATLGLVAMGRRGPGANAAMDSAHARGEGWPGHAASRLADPEVLGQLPRVQPLQLDHRGGHFFDATFGIARGTRRVAQSPARMTQIIL